jgi:hypothetical protein
MTNTATSRELVDAIAALRSIYNDTAIGGNFENGVIAEIARRGLGYPPDQCKHQNDFTNREDSVIECDDCGIVLEDLSPRDLAVEFRRLQERNLMATHQVKRVAGHLERLASAIGKDRCDEGELVDAILRKLSCEPLSGDALLKHLAGQCQAIWRTNFTIICTLPKDHDGDHRADCGYTFNGEVDVRASQPPAVNDAQKAALVSVLRDLREGIAEHATDIVWYSPIQTACDRIDEIVAAIASPTTAGEQP